MILADSSIWIDHLHRPIEKMIDLLERDAILMHDFVLAEIALGSLFDRTAMLTKLAQLPVAVVAEHDEILNLIDGAQLFATGVGYVDVHLIASVMLTDDALLWTRDKCLRRAAQRLEIAVPAE